MFEIEKGITIPERRTGGRKAKYPFDKLEPGDSFFVPGKKSMGSTVQSAMKRYNIKLVAVTREEKGVVGVRVWRLPDEDEPNGDNPPTPLPRGRRRAA